MITLLIATLAGDALHPAVRRTLFVVGAASAAWQIRKYLLLRKQIMAEGRAAIIDDMQAVKKQIREQFKTEPRFIGIGIIINGIPQFEILVEDGTAEEFRKAMGDSVEGYHVSYIETKRPEAQVQKMSIDTDKPGPDKI